MKTRFTVHIARGEWDASVEKTVCLLQTFFPDEFRYYGGPDGGHLIVLFADVDVSALRAILHTLTEKRDISANDKIYEHHRT